MSAPLDMVLHCPKCGMQHIDQPETDAQYTVKLHESSWWELGGDKPERWMNPPHKSHLCRKEEGGCGTVWRPADVPTNGVAELKTRGKADTWPVSALASDDCSSCEGSGSQGPTGCTDCLGTGVDSMSDRAHCMPVLSDPLGCRACTHPDCGRYDGPRQVECRAMPDNACARPVTNGVPAVPASGPLRDLGAYLARVLDEDQWAHAEALLLKATDGVRAVAPTITEGELWAVIHKDFPFATDRWEKLLTFGQIKVVVERALADGVAIPSEGRDG